MDAQMIRHILADYARKRAAAKREGNAIALLRADSPAISREPKLDLLVLEDAMHRLASPDPRKCKIVDFLFFGGLSIEEAACVFNISPATPKREWATARLWFLPAITDGAQP